MSKDSSDALPYLKAFWQETTLALSGKSVEFEGIVYFPPSGVHKQHLELSGHRDTHGQLGEATYFDVIVGEERLVNGARTYPNPTGEAAHIQGFIAFAPEVTVQHSDG
jgi:uncharacterized protein (DUF427 family)